MGKKIKETKEKPLEKMTANELRDVGKQIPELTGVHGMNKAELISAIKKARGVTGDSVKKSDSSVRKIKKKIKKLRTEQEAALNDNDNKMAQIYRRRITRLKKKTRRVA